MVCNKNGKIRYEINGHTLERSLGYCFDDKFLVLKSIDWKKRKIAKGNIFSKYGSPYFNLCRQNKGKGLQIKYLAQSAWREQSICIFDDMSFIDVYHLD